jgi:predicted MPP superfamily phosphohydrolase
LAGLLGRSFGSFRLAAYGLFLHGVVLLVGSAVVFRRRGSHRAATIGLLVMAVALVGVAADAFLIEPTWLEVSYVRLRTPKVDRRLRIVVVADLQTDQLGRYERTVLRRALREGPDVILLAGDYLQAPTDQYRRLSRQLNAFLREIGFGRQAEAFAVQGNIDRADWPKIFAGTKVTAVRATRRFEVAGLVLTCLSEPASGDNTLHVDSPGSDRFHVVLGHRPDYALGTIEADLLLAGHTHGGQVRLPLVGPLLTLSRVPRSWAAGRTDWPDGRTLVVSRGIGMERLGAPRLRFLCRPELVVIDLLPAAD